MSGDGLVTGAAVGLVGGVFGAALFGVIGGTPICFVVG